MKEIHLFIIWSKAVHKKNQIINDIKSQFTICRILNVTWTKDTFSNNLSRFYGENLPSSSHKEKHCGTGTFCCIIVKDSKPLYEVRETSKGPKVVNARVFDAKQLYRIWTGGGHKIHASDNIYESRQQIALLFGKSLNYYLALSDCTNEVNYCNDLVAAHGWESFDHLFEILNLVAKYVVLRNFENLEDELNNLHPDVDLLVEDKESVVYLLNAQQTSTKNYRVQYSVRIKNKNIRFDLRHPGDNYFDLIWQNNILGTRKKQENLFIPNEINHFYSLLYHAVVHKKHITRDYLFKLMQLSQSINLDLKTPDMQEEKLLDMLMKFLYKNNYRITEPNDLTVYYNTKILRKKIILNASKVRVVRQACQNLLVNTKYLITRKAKQFFLIIYYFQDNISILFYIIPIILTLKKHGIKNLKKFKPEAWHLKYAFFTGYLGSRKIFIKVDFGFNMLENDVLVYNLCRDELDKHLVKILLHKLHGKIQFVAYEYINSPIYLTYSQLIHSETYLGDIFNILVAIAKKGIIHRDIKLDNFLISNNELKIIDFTFSDSINNKNFKKLDPSNSKHCYILECLGAGLNPTPFVWDDFYSFTTILDNVKESVNGSQINFLNTYFKQFNTHIGKYQSRQSPTSKRYHIQKMMKAKIKKILKFSSSQY